LIDYYKNQVSDNFPSYNKDLAVLANYIDKEQLTFKKGSRDKIIESRNKSFELAFGEMKPQIEAILRSVYGIVIHIYFNREVVKGNLHWDIFYRQLSTPELNMIFYGFFSSSGMYEPYYEQIFASFLKKIEEHRLYQSGDFYFLDEIEQPNIGFVETPKYED
jgi:hypothetical protein